MAEIRSPSPTQLEQARAALLPIVCRAIEGEASPLWRASHAALCRIEEAMGMAPTVPAREARRRAPSEEARGRDE